VRDVYKGGLSKLGATCAEKAPVMCRQRRGGRLVSEGEEGYCCARARRGRNDVDRGAAIKIRWQNYSDMMGTQLNIRLEWTWLGLDDSC
jgi:hypothetical protein